MKKITITLAALGSLGAAHAQSSLTIYGIVDAAVRVVNNSGGPRSTALSSGHNAASRLGFRGREDLGGGWSAGFTLETGFNVDTGLGFPSNTNNQVSGRAGGNGLTFNRRSTVSLFTPLGEIRLGRDYTPQFWNTLYFDPFHVGGVGASQIFNSYISGPTAVRASNSIGYILPSNRLRGFYGQVMYHLGENASNVANPDDGNGYGGRIGYAAGPINMAVAYGRTQFAAGDGTQGNLGIAYDFKAVKAFGLVERERLGSLRLNGWLAGVSVPVGVGEVRLAYSRVRTSGTAATAVVPTAQKLAVGYVHNLSKRTALFVDAAVVRNSHGGTAAVYPRVGNPVANQRSSGFDVGMRHSF